GDSVLRSWHPRGFEGACDHERVYPTMRLQGKGRDHHNWPGALRRHHAPGRLPETGSRDARDVVILMKCQHLEAEMLRNARRIITTIAGLGLGVALLAGAAAAELKVGDKAPDFTLQGSDGKTYSLEQFRGKSGVVIAWFPKAMTKGCTIECKSLKAHSKELKGLNVAYFTASVDKPEENKKFADQLDADYPILSDPDKMAAQAYGVMSPRGFANRWTFYIDKDGVIKEIDKKVNVQTAAEDLCAKVKELGLEGK